MTVRPKDCPVNGRHWWFARVYVGRRADVLCECGVFWTLSKEVA